MITFNSFSSDRRGTINTLAVVIVVVLLVLMAALAYFLFFAAPPRVEVILSPQLKSTNEISRVNFEELIGVVNQKEFKSLEAYTGLPSTGPLGRANPFLDYQSERNKSARP